MPAEVFTHDQPDHRVRRPGHHRRRRVDGRHHPQLVGCRCGTGGSGRGARCRRGRRPGRAAHPGDPRTGRRWSCPASRTPTSTRRSPGATGCTCGCNDLTGRQAYLDRIADYARANPDEPWIVGGGWAMEHFPGGLPVREDLDAVVPDRPVFLMNRDVHVAWVNSRALELAGITAGTDDPADGRIERDPRTGEPTGALHEGAAYSFQDRHVPLPTAHDWERAILEAQGHLHSLGITGWQDAWVTPATLEAYRSLGRAGRLTARVVGALWWDRHRGLDQVTEFLTQREAGAVRRLPPHHGQDHDRRGAGEPHRRAARALLRRLRRADRQPRAVVRRPRAARAPRSPSSTATASRCTCTPSGTGPCATRWTPSRRPAPRTVPATTGTTSPTSRWSSPRTCRGSAELGVVANAQAYWAQMEPQMEELHHPVPRPRPGPPAVPVRRPAAVRGRPSRWAATGRSPPPTRSGRSRSR